jgi:citrate lyase subunit beta/citryl-CoA lyase
MSPTSTTQRPTRSQLYVPGHRQAWFAKALRSGADALILDLEDAVPADSKVQARRTSAEFVAARRGEPGPVLLVRVNAATTAEHLDDVLAMVEAGADGIVLPKVCGPDDIVANDRLLGLAERRDGRPVGGTLIVPVLETAAGIRAAHAIGLASPRIAYLGGLTARGGDIEGAVGFRWSPGGDETLTLRAQVLLDARAAGVPHPVTGMWTDVEDVDGLAAFARQSRDLGYAGMTVIHPSHVPVVNAAFDPSPEELDRDRRLLEAMRRAEEDGTAAVRFEGHMVDIAMVRTAQERLARSRPQATP